MTSGVDRRDFLKIAGIGVASGAAAGCSPPRTEEKIIPHVVPPADQIPGQETWYNSTCSECGAGCGIRVRNREGRALRIMGNTEHPVSKGGLCTQGHSSLQATYHPDRYRAPLKGKQQLAWDDALQQVSNAVAGGKVAFLTGNLPASTLSQLIDDFVEKTSAVRAIWEPIQYAPLAAATEIVFGAKVVPAFNFDQANYILSVGADFLESWLNPVANQKGFAQSHGYQDGKGLSAKHVHVDPRMGVTGANADEWLVSKPGYELNILGAILKAIIDSGSSQLSSSETSQIKAWLGSMSIADAAKQAGLTEAAINQIANNLLSAAPGLVIAGGAYVQGGNATQVQVAALLINKAIGAVGSTVSLADQATIAGGQDALSLEGLLAKIDQGEVDTLFIYKSNPIYDAPAALNVKQRLNKVKTIVALDALPNETTAIATYVLPDHTPLESWGDNLAQQGVASLQQPTMNPLFDTRAVGDTILSLMPIEPGADTDAGVSFLGRLQQSWAERLVAASVSWKKAVQAGGVWENSTGAVNAGSLGDLTTLGFEPGQSAVGAGEFALLAYPHIHRYDGRFSNRGWCQEIPDPLMQASWSHWAEIHPKTADSLGIGHKDKIQLKTSAGSIETYAFVTSMVAPDTIATPLGQGHGDDIGRFGSGIAGNVYALLGNQKDKHTGAFVLGGNAVKVTKLANANLDSITAISYDLVTTDGRKTDLGRGIGQVIGLDTISKIDAGEMEPIKPVHHGTHVKNKNGFYPPQEHPDHRWGMSIDLGSCTGCGACVAACYSENNIPLVGKELVGMGREMAWLRIERYFDSEKDAQQGVQFVPMLCQHCDNAPCEPVCPVIATYHTVDGLNGMVYNRCVGTRYCGNNCSYKVRRFNYFGYDDSSMDHYAWPSPMDLMLNPDISVRSAGVMEKCTFCMHLIRDEVEKSRMTGKPIEDGAVQTACQASCPSDSIVFGDLMDEKSEVTKLSKTTNRGYKILDVLNTQPAITYQKRVRHKKTLT